VLLLLFFLGSGDLGLGLGAHDLSCGLLLLDSDWLGLGLLNVYWFRLSDGLWLRDHGLLLDDLGLRLDFSGCVLDDGIVLLLGLLGLPDSAALGLLAALGCAGSVLVAVDHLRVSSAADCLGDSIAELLERDVCVRNILLAGVGQLGPALDEAITLLSPVDGTLTSAKKLVDAFAEVLDTFIDILRDGLSTFEHAVHRKHVGDVGDRLSLDSGDLLGVLLLGLVLGSSGLVLTLDVHVNLLSDLLNLCFEGGLAGNLFELLGVGVDLLVLDLLLEAGDGVNLLLLVSNLLQKLFVEGGDLFTKVCGCS